MASHDKWLKEIGIGNIEYQHNRECLKCVSEMESDDYPMACDTHFRDNFYDLVHSKLKTVCEARGIEVVPYNVPYHFEPGMLLSAGKLPLPLGKGELDDGEGIPYYFETDEDSDSDSEESDIPDVWDREHPYISLMKYVTEGLSEEDFAAEMPLPTGWDAGENPYKKAANLMITLEVSDEFESPESRWIGIVQKVDVINGERFLTVKFGEDQIVVPECVIQRGYTRIETAEEECMRGQPPSIIDCMRYAHLLSKELELHPKSFFAEIKLHKICLVSNLTNDGALRSAIPASTIHTLFLDPSCPLSKYNYSAHSFHHELHHMVDYARHGTYYPEDEGYEGWIKLNPKEAEYGNGGAAFNETDADCNAKVPFYVSLYAKSGPEEDRAETYAKDIMQPKFVARYKFPLHVDTIKKKSREVWKLIHKLCEDMNFNGEFGRKCGVWATDRQKLLEPQCIKLNGA